jgi:two-component system cell cycle sensor histidine kinase PleC
MNATSQLMPDEFERRVLERQLVLLSTPTRGAIIGTPMWAAAVCWITSGAFPALGAANTLLSLGWLAAIIAVCLVALLVDRRYRSALADAATFDPKRWAWRYTSALALLSCTWAGLIWVFWQDGNPTNQLSLTVLVFCGITNGIISRMNKYETFLVGSGLAVLVLWLKFLTESSEVASIFALLLPLWFIAMALNVKAASAQVRKNIATQIDNEALTVDLAVARDEAEAERQNAERANRMKSAFLANMSHELRTPMNAILGFSEIISEQALGPDAHERYRDYAADIMGSGRHLLSLINDLLDIAKIEAGKMKLEAAWLDGRMLVAQAMKLLQERADEKGLGLLFEGDDVRVYADERAFNQIMLNLLSNAVKFTERGQVTARLSTEPGAVVLTVQDTGCGIPREQVERVFESFEQVDNRYTRANGGTGLGLTLVRALAELHGGSCRIASEEGKGTRVEVRLPHPCSESQANAA